MLSYRTEVQQRTPMSEERILDELKRTQVFVVKARKGRNLYAMPLALNLDAKHLYKLLHLSHTTENLVVD